MQSHLRPGNILLAVLICLQLQPSKAEHQSAESKFLEIPGGVRIHYIEKGSSKLSLCFIPGWTMPAEIWEPQLDHFGKKYRVVAIDPRSQGLSTQTSEGNYSAMRAMDLSHVTRRLNLKPVVLIAWSQGVSDVVHYIDQFGTDTIAGIVLIDGIVGSDRSQILVSRTLHFIRSLQANRREATEIFVRKMFKRTYGETFYHRLVESSLQTPTNTAIASLAAGLAADDRPALRKINKPALILVSQGPYFPEFQDMHRRIAGSKLEVFKDSGHALFIDEADRFNRLLEQFIENLPAQR